MKISIWLDVETPAIYAGVEAHRIDHKASNAKLGQLVRQAVRAAWPKAEVKTHYDAANIVGVQHTFEEPVMTMEEYNHLRSTVETIWASRKWVTIHRRWRSK